MKKLFLAMGFFSLLIGMNACKGKQEKQEQQEISAIDADHNSKNSLNWNGTYTGIIPCADCSGIKTKVVLNLDHTYSISREYLDKKEAVYNYSGTFVWSEDGGSISLQEGSREPVTRFKVGENKLFQLDLEGNVITGELADKYLLTKAD